MLLTPHPTMAPARERVEVIDVLRGVALMSIVLVHYPIEFAGWSTLYTSSVPASSLSTAAADSGVVFLLNLFLVNKARALFAFLFGVGFYYQLAKTKHNGHNITHRFAKRMFALLAVGVAHAYLLWSGDILRLYAVCGLALLLLYRWKSKPLFITAVVMSVVAPAVAVVLHYHFHFNPLTDAMKEQMYNGFAGNSYTALWKANRLRDLAVTWNPMSACNLWLPVLGNFIFGYWAAQTHLFTKLTHHKTLLRNCVFFSGCIGFLCSNSFVRLAAKGLGATEDDIPANWHDALALPAAFSVEALAFCLLCGVVYLYRQPLLQRRLSAFRFAGRMTLTNYILQSLFGVFFFYGIGLGNISRFGSLAALGLATALFFFQLLYSRWWLQRFTMGPVEWLWRSLAEGKWQRMKRRKEANMA